MKWGGGLIYTTIIFYLLWYGEVWLTGYIFRLNWFGAIMFWVLGLPTIIGIFQFAASLLAIPSAYLMKGSKWFSWALLLPCIYLMWFFVKILWTIASHEGVLQWLLAITWFCEIVWLNIAYLMICIVASYEPTKDNAALHHVNSQFSGFRTELGTQERTDKDSTVHKTMTDTRFKWLTGCVALCVVAIAAMIIFKPTTNADRQKHEPKGVGEYVYIDWADILHIDRKCSRLNYKGMTSRRVKVEELSTLEFDSFCPKCVDDESYKALQ